MKYLVWLFWAAVFFTLFAFSVNNLEPVTVAFFFGLNWSAPLVFVVLAAIFLGLLTGILLMLPRLWKYRRMARQAHSAAPAQGTGSAGGNQADSEPHGV